MTLRPATLLLLALATVAAPAFAARQGPAPTFVSTGWLARHLGDPDLVVLHASSQRADYDAGHVPGARFLAFSSFAGPHDSLSTEMPSEAKLDSLLEAAGVSDGSRVVLTGGPVTVLSRLFVTLDWFGIGDRVSMLNGGIDAWREEGRPVSRDSAAVARGSLTPHPAPQHVVDADWLAPREGATPGLAVVDARTPEFFQGLASNSNPRAGRLPAAGNVPFSWLTGELGRFRNARDLERLFENAGVRRDDRVVTYCHIGIQACVAYVAARSLGHDVALYDGSFEDWSRRSALPVATGPAGEGRKPAR